ncbi:hypothetical protein CKM354_001132200 [Cercospora kikuchii]|uniref:Uncharacterized protein n=1 Tax=Cercospora kikuchii TaxID=84275 RepID=A0A9P3FL00_9PEZI|nr:uncharacterized protein CKM354_001132200 [Cercospora kikuchii]GIZ48254.1 hypothetical protein CKM354_001132200 [Cercospora kikuchii]
MILLKSLIAIPGIAQIPVAISAAWFSFFSRFSKWTRHPKVSKMEAPARMPQSITPISRDMAYEAKARNQARQIGRAASMSVEGKADTEQATTDPARTIRILLKFIIVVAAAYVLAARFGSQLLQYTLYVVTDIRFIAYFCILAVVFTWLRDRGLVRDPCWCYGM